jgi:hypothetical protein
MCETAEKHGKLRGHAIALCCLVFGVGLLASSFLPFDWLTAQSWTPQDTERYDQLSLEYHRSAFMEPERSGRSPKELQAYRQKLQQRYEAMRARLEAARSQPHQWSGYLRWSGVGLAALGCLIFVAQGE